MASIHSSKSATEPRPEIRTASCYMQPAPTDEVMMEQLEFLLLHSRKGRHADCAVCARLDHIGGALLAPFL
jgi:hypothetical protein